LHFALELTGRRMIMPIHITRRDKETTSMPDLKDSRIMGIGRLGAVAYNVGRKHNLCILCGSI